MGFGSSRFSRRNSQVFENMAVIFGRCTSVWKHRGYFQSLHKCLKTGCLSESRHRRQKRADADEAFLRTPRGFFMLLIQRSANEGNYRHPDFERKGFEMRGKVLEMG
jgi:hypothetical protein